MADFELLKTNEMLWEKNDEKTPAFTTQLVSLSYNDES